MAQAITYKELFTKPEKTIPVGTAQSEVAKIPAKSSMWGLFYDTTDLSPETLESYLLDPTKAKDMPLMMSLVPSQEEWIVQAAETYKVTAEALPRIQLWLPFKDYTKFLDTLVFHQNQILISKLPKPYYKESERRVFVGFIFFVAHLEPYEGQ